MAGTFIAFEGGDASGKSTQARLLAEHLGARSTREPGSTELGERVRQILLHADDVHLDPRAEALLFAAARAEHIAEVIGPALERGETVVADRYIASSLAYQGYGRGLPVDEIQHINEWATGGLWPDLIVLLDVPLETAALRLADDLDKLEAAGDEFHQRVDEGYRKLAAADPDRWLVIDGTGAIDEVATRVREAVDRWLTHRVG
ncbi:MAG: dTMP kinase [Acidimicrobiales bacterium]